MLLAAASVGLMYTRSKSLVPLFGITLRFAREHWTVSGSLLVGWGCLGVQWLWRTAMTHNATLGLIPAYMTNGGNLFSAVHNQPDAVLFGLNHTVLLMSQQQPLAPGIANLFAYMVIALATYALARRYAWPPTAVTVTLLVISMPRLAHQSLVTYSELPSAATALLAILALYRTVEERHALDASMLICTISFSVAGGRTCYLMPIVLASLSLMVMARRHDMRLWSQTVHRHRLLVLLSCSLVLIFSQIIPIAINLEAGRAWIGELTADTVIFNPDALRGTAANMVRYLLQSIQFPEVIDRFSQWALGFSGLAGLKWLYQVVIAPLAGGKGAAAPFYLTWQPVNGGGWFGPVGFLMVLPSLAKAFLRGPYRLKTTALAIAVYWVLIALILAWQPANVRLMTPFFVCSGFTLAFFLPPWRLSRKGRLILQLVGVLLLAGDILPWQ
jgi:hypothetical protein